MTITIPGEFVVVLVFGSLLALAFTVASLVTLTKAVSRLIEQLDQGDEEEAGAAIPEGLPTLDTRGAVARPQFVSEV